MLRHVVACFKCLRGGGGGHSSNITKVAETHALLLQNAPLTTCKDSTQWKIHSFAYWSSF